MADVERSGDAVGTGVDICGRIPFGPEVSTGSRRLPVIDPQLVHNVIHRL